MNDMTVTHLEARLKRVERQNRVLILLICGAIGIAAIGATRAGADPAVAQEIRAHKFSVVDPTGAVIDSWYSIEPGIARRP
jgi:Zn-dependent alcohol dehydrogenase